MPKSRSRTLISALMTSTALAAPPAYAAEIIDGTNETVIGGGGGTQASPWNIADDLIVANSGTGTLAVSNGGAVSNDDGYIGYNSSAMGTVTVTGAGSTWTNGFNLYTGYSGTGSLLVEDGGVVVNTDAFIGTADSGVGDVTVSGLGSILSNSGDLHAGYSGAGSLTIEDGGFVGSVGGFIAEDANATGDVTVTGAGSSWTMSDDLFVGYNGVGTLTISNGGGVSSTADGSIGAGSNAIGTVTVTGPGSSLTTATNLMVGRSGTGTLNIEDGATVTSTTEGHIAESGDSVGVVTVTGTGSSWTTGGLLVVGRIGDATLNIEDGGSVTSGTDGIVGYFAAATGAVNVTGAGSTWINSDDLRVGENTSGMLAITEGGSVSSGDDTFIGNGLGSTGAVTVTGAGSSLSVGDELILGTSGDGTLTIEDGGSVSDNVGYVGMNTGFSGDVTVTGAGASWTTLTTLYVAEAGTGTLTIEDGGSVSDADGYIGFSAGSDGSVMVTGPGSSWTHNFDLSIGDTGDGELTIANGGLVHVGTVVGVTTLASAAASSGTLNIGAAAGDAATEAGTLNSATLAFGAGNGLLVFNHTDTDYIFDTAMSGNGRINHHAGTTTLTADNSVFLGTTTVLGGSLLVDDFLGGFVEVHGGLLGGTGVLEQVAVDADSTIAPGNSIGVLTMDDVTFEVGSIYEVEVNGAGNSDRINVANTATLNGGTVEVVPFPDYALGTTYTILTATGGVAGTFDTANFGSGSLFVTPELTYDANNAYVTLAQAADFASVAMTPNQIAAAGGAQSLGAGNTIFDAIAMLGAIADAQAAFDAISGEVHATARTALMEDSRFPREAALGRLRIALGGGGAGTAQEKTPEGTAVWARGLGAWGRWNEDGNAAELHRDIGGFFVGADAEVVDGAYLGVMGGYSRSSLSVSDRMSSGSIDSYTLGAYAGGTRDEVSLKGGVAYSWNDIDISRSAVFPGFSDSLSADYKARTFQAYSELAYSIEFDDGRVEPFADLAYVNLDADGFSEKGGAAALTSAEQKLDAAFATLGTRGEAQVGLDGRETTLRGGIGWRHVFGNTPTATHSFAGGNSFTVAGIPLARNAVVLEAGFNIALADNATVDLAYDGQLGSDIADHSARVSLNVWF